jgi:ABC-type sugar transport system permease subunit
MKLDPKARLIAAVLLGLVVGVTLRLYNLKTFHMSRDEFLAGQAARYDRLLAVHPSAFTAIVVAILMVGVAVGLYELLAFAVARALSRTVEESHAEGS